LSIDKSNIVHLHSSLISSFIFGTTPVADVPKLASCRHITITITVMTNDLVNSWAYTATAIFFLAARIAGRGITRQILDFGDYLAMAAAICLLAAAARAVPCQFSADSRA
jgi:hypothetical protein